jgi:hypothetical protein
MRQQGLDFGTERFVATARLRNERCARRRRAIEGLLKDLFDPTMARSIVHRENPPQALDETTPR